MAINLTDDIWLKDGERASAGILNRPLKAAVEQINQEFVNLGTSIQTANILPASLGTQLPDDTLLDTGVTNGKVVYFDTTDNKYKLASRDNVSSSKFAGVYNRIEKDGVVTHRIISLGEAEVPASLQATTIGTVYYLTTNGDLSNTDTTGATVGVCSGANKILVSNISAAKAPLQERSVVIRDQVTQYSINYVPGRTMFFVEGILLPKNEIEATNGTSVTVKFVPKDGDILTAVVIE